MTTIDGQDIHFLHVRSPKPSALPLLVIHGWPSSPVEFLRVIEPLTDPAASGGDSSDAFHLVILSLPGYGFSTPVAEPGWGNLFRVAAPLGELMSVFWFTGAGASSAHATYEGMQAWRLMAARQAAEPGGHHAQQPDAPGTPADPGATLERTAPARPPHRP